MKNLIRYFHTPAPVSELAFFGTTSIYIASYMYRTPVPVDIRTVIYSEDTDMYYLTEIRAYTLFPGPGGEKAYSNFIKEILESFSGINIIRFKNIMLYNFLTFMTGWDISFYRRHVYHNYPALIIEKSDNNPDASFGLSCGNKAVFSGIDYIGAETLLNIAENDVKDVLDINYKEDCFRINDLTTCTALNISRNYISLTDKLIYSIDDMFLRENHVKINPSGEKYLHKIISNWLEGEKSERISI